jgi:hypothetical protein
LHEVTITHPFHPLRGQPVQVLCVYQRLPEADLYVQAADGATFCIAMSLTDYGGASDSVQATHRLTWQGLREIAQFIQHKRQP